MSGRPTTRRCVGRLLPLCHHVGTTGAELNDLHCSLAHSLCAQAGFGASVRSVRTTGAWAKKSGAAASPDKGDVAKVGCLACCFKGARGLHAGHAMLQCSCMPTVLFLLRKAALHPHPTPPPSPPRRAAAYLCSSWAA